MDGKQYAIPGQKHLGDNFVMKKENMGENATAFSKNTCTIV
jgi:hypothetical protein